MLAEIKDDSELTMLFATAVTACVFLSFVWTHVIIPSIKKTLTAEDLKNFDTAVQQILDKKLQNMDSRLALFAGAHTATPIIKKTLTTEDLENINTTVQQTLDKKLQNMETAVQQLLDNRLQNTYVKCYFCPEEEYLHMDPSCCNIGNKVNVEVNLRPFEIMSFYATGSRVYRCKDCWMKWSSTDSA